MPRDEIEVHPYLALGQGINNPQRLILGSFPVYECTDPDSPLKQQRRNDGTMRFFYGSVDSSFWSLYRRHVDQNIVLPPNPGQIINSLQHRSISISDVIYRS